MFNCIKTIKWSDFFELTDKQITTFKITPDKTVGNGGTPALARSFHELYSTPKDRIQIDLKTVTVTYILKDEIYFDIIFKPGQTYFYLSIPTRWSAFIKTKCENIWPRCAIDEVEKKELIGFDPSKCEVCELKLTKANMFSLQTNHNNIYPLTSMMSVLKDMKDDDKLRVSYIFDPMNRESWTDKASGEMKEYRNGREPQRTALSKEYLFSIAVDLIGFILQMYIEIRMMVFESLLIFGSQKNDREDRYEKYLEKRTEQELALDKLKKISISEHTTQKITAPPFKTSIRILSQSEDVKRRNINLKTVANSFNDLSGDNELKVVNFNPKAKFKEIMRILQFKSSIQIDPNIMSDAEVSKFIQLPQVTLQEEYKLDRIDTTEVDVPPELQNGDILLGVAEKQRKVIKAYFCKDKNIAGNPLIIAGPPSAGKTTLLKRIVRDSHTKAKYSNIYIDFIENCHNSDEVAEAIPDSEKVMIRLGDKDLIPAMAFNEVSNRITEDMDPWDRVKYANMIAEQVEYLINSVTDKTTGDLTSPMLRYLHSACMVVFIKPGAKINDVFEVLRKWQVRNEYIRYAKYDSNCFDKDDDVFYDLEELRETDDKGKITGTRENLIIGITNRITVLKKNPYLKAMLKADINNDFDLLDLIEQGKSIFIQIPQPKFPNPKTKDILSTFFMSRIWLAAQLRENNKDARLCKIIFDEVHQVPTCASFIKNHVTEFRRHRLGLLITCHYFKQFGDLFDAIKSAGTSYMLLAGTEKENLEKLKEELKPFSIEECLSPPLKPFHSVNIINYGNQYAKFICHQPEK